MKLKNKTSSDMKKMKDSIASNPALREMLKEVFLGEGKRTEQMWMHTKEQEHHRQDLKLSCYLNIFKRYLNIIKILLRY